MLKIYGQSRLFGAFVRKIGSETPEFLRTNGHFSSRPFTDKAFVFNDLSVNDSDFAKCRD